MLISYDCLIPNFVVLTVKVPQNILHIEEL